MLQSNIRVQLSDGERRERRRRNVKRRVGAYGSLAAIAWGFWSWVPWEFDWVPRELPNPNPRVDPNSRALFAKGTKVLVVTAHPDDSAFYIGGILTQLGRAGAEVHQVICTDGDKAYYGVFASPQDNRRVRRSEAVEELHAWGGKDVLFLGRADGRLRADESLVARIRQEIERLKPEFLLCFDGDYPPRLSHQDHRRSGDAAEAAVKDRTTSVRWLMKFSTIAPNWVCDITEDWDAQKNLLQIHRSQFHGEHLERVTSMVESSAMADGELGGCSYGEGFRCIRLR